jgi:hypothetical protein
VTALVHAIGGVAARFRRRRAVAPIDDHIARLLRLSAAARDAHKAITDLALAWDDAATLIGCTRWPDLDDIDRLAKLVELSTRSAARHPATLAYQVARACSRRRTAALGGAPT